MDKKIMIGVAVVAVIIVAAAAVVMLKKGGDEFSIDEYPDTYLTVLGNAEPDLVIDSKDIKAIERFINNGTADKSGYKYKDYYMYDANFDKKIDQNDADIVAAMVRCQTTGDWTDCQYVYYVNVDKEVAKYDMTISEMVVTLIAPPLDTVLAIGGADLVVGTDNRITTGKYHEEYETALDFDRLVDVGDCKEPDLEKISTLSDKYDGVNVVCGTQKTYGPTMEKVFKNTDVQVIRIGSWEYGTTLYGFHTLAFLLKQVEESQDFYAGYVGINTVVKEIVNTVDPSKKAPGKIGAAACYGYLDELSLLGFYTGEYTNLMVLEPYDTAEAYLGGGESGGHGDTITTEDVSAMYQKYYLKNLFLLIGTPFQIVASEGDAQSSQNYMKNIYKTWSDRIGAKQMHDLNISVSGYSFSSGVSEVLNQLIHCYYLYNDEFLAYFDCDTQEDAQDILAGYVDWYCESINIDEKWSFYGEEDGGPEGTIGMNLLYCGEDDDRNILYGVVSKKG